MALYRAIFFQMKTYVVARVCSPLRSRIKRTRRKAKGREMKGQLPEEKRDSKSRIRSGGTANQSSSVRGWFCSPSYRQGEGVKGQRYIYWTEFCVIYCRRERRKRKQPRKGFKPGMRLEFQRSPYGFLSGGIKTRERFTFQLEDMSILAERQTAMSKKLQQGIWKKESGILRSFLYFFLPGKISKFSWNFIWTNF